MKSILYVAAILVGLLGSAAPAARSDTAFFDCYGFSYLEGDPFTAGTLVTIPLLFNEDQPHPVFGLDLVHNEYTVLITDLVISGVQNNGGVQVVTYSGGRISVYEDPARNARWTPWPPNGVVPGVFADGTALLTGSFRDCVLVFDTGSEVGSVQGHLDFTGGTRLHDVVSPDGWFLLGGTTTNPAWDIPDGYDMAWDTQLIPPSTVATQPATWGRIRSLYR
jgi:hypothetical protein